MNIILKKIVTLVLFMVSIFILSGCELLEPGTQDGGATPIYQGMTISDSMQNLSAQSTENKPSKLRLNKSYFFNANFTIDDAIGDEFDFESNEELDYYSSVDTDLYITVNLNNPDGQAILRFTLNEVIYQSYQFQEGSDSEHLILKVNSGSTAGIKEFTIDEIKYVENVTNLTKDALFDGDKTIQLGVTYNSIPTAAVNNEVVNATSFSLDLVITDEEELISKSGNLLKALLYDGEEVVQSIDLTIDTTSIRFDKLNPNQNYEYAIATVIDSLDGNNNRIHILHSGEITTTDLLAVENVVSTQDSITFEVSVTDVDEVGSITAIELYKGETLIEALTDLSLRTFTDLLSNNEYQIEVTYTYDLNDGIGEQTIVISDEVTTQAKATPVVLIENVVSTQDSITFEVSVTDVDEVGSITAIELYQGEVLIETLTDLSLRTFTNLLSNNEYQVKVTYTYDVNDGVGAQTLIITETATTLAKATPVVLIENAVSTQDTITFEINVTDVDEVGSITAIELYKGETLVEVLADLSLRTFTNLLSNNEYQVKVSYTYDLNDGVGEQTLVITKDSTTQAKATPIVLIENAVSTQDSITFEINVTDVDEVGSITAIELYKGETLVEVLADLSLRTFTNLLSNNEYQVKVSYTYDLNDGVGEQTLVITKDSTTQAKAKPIFLIENAVSTQDSITFDINITDVDEVGSITAIELYQGETLVEALADLSLRTFTNLLSNNEYQVKVTYTYDLNDGVGEQTLVITKDSTTQAKAKPIVLIENAVSTQDSITFDINITDVDEVGSITAIELYKDETLVEALTDLSLRTFTNLLSNNEYQMKITYTYNLNDGSQSISVVFEELFKTAPDLEATNLAIVNNDELFIGNTMIVDFVFQSIPTNIIIESVMINGQWYNAEKTNLQNRIRIKINLDESFQVGLNSLKLEEIIASDVDGTVFQLDSIFERDFLVSYVFDIYGANITDLAGNTVDYMVHGSQYKMIIELNNLGKLDINSIVINDVLYEIDMIEISEDKSKISIVFTSNTANSTVYVNSIEYVDKEEIIMKSINRTFTSYILLDSDEIYYIENAFDLMNMTHNSYYVLMNDIDLSTVSWTPYSFSGILDGNGFTISNIEKTHFSSSSNPYSFALFTSFLGRVQNLTIKKVYIDISTQGNVTISIFSNNLNGEVRNLNIQDSNITINSMGSVKYGTVSTSGYNVLMNNLTIDSLMITVCSNSHSLVGGVASNISGKVSKTSVSNLSIDVSNTANAYTMVSGYIASESIDTIKISNSKLLNVLITTNVVDGNNSSNISGFISVYNPSARFALIDSVYISNFKIVAQGDFVFANAIFAGRTNVEITNTVIYDIDFNISDTSFYRQFTNNIDGIATVSSDNKILNNNVYVVNNYRIEKNSSMFIIDDNLLITQETFFLEAFWINTLNWDIVVWNFNDLTLEGSLGPSLQN